MQSPVVGLAMLPPPHFTSATCFLVHALNQSIKSERTHEATLVFVLVAANAVQLHTESAGSASTEHFHFVVG